MHKDLIVAIFVPTTGQGRTPGRVGTGYPVTDDLILTARHVIEPENRNRQQPLRVRWFHDKPADGKPPEWTPLDDHRNGDILVWVGTGDLDAALLRCRRPDYLRTFSLDRLAERKPRESERWQSAGFARANRCGDVRKPGKFGGILREPADDDAFFELLEDAQPIAEEQWQGVSGMPVFAGSELLGVVKHVPPNYDHKKLEAVPAWRLLRDEGFKKALGIDEQRERLESARTLLRRLLERSDAATDDFAAELGLPRDDLPKCREQVVERLLGETLERLFDLALSVQEKRRLLKDQAGAGVAVDLTLAVLPAVHDAAVVSDVRRRKGAAGESIVSLPAESRTLAEIIMAGADRRAARFRLPLPREGHFPAGEYDLPDPPEPGRDAAGKRVIEDWRDHLVTVFGKDSDEFERDFRAYLKERFIQSDMRSSAAADAEERLRKSVADELNYLAEKKRQTRYYCIAQMSADPTVRQKQETTLAKLKKDFPAIAFLLLAGGEGLDVERRCYRPLCDLLYETPDTKP